MHFFRRRRPLGRGQGGGGGRGGQQAGLVLVLLGGGLGGQQAGDLGAVQPGEDLGVRRVPLGDQFAPQAAPARGLDRPPQLQSADEAQVGGAHLVVGPDVLIDGQVQHVGGGIVLVDAAPAVFAGAAAEGRQAQVMAAADGLGVQPGEIVVARLGPGFGGSDAVGIGHGRECRGPMRRILSYRCFSFSP